MKHDQHRALKNVLIECLATLQRFKATCNATWLIKAEPRPAKDRQGSRRTDEHLVATLQNRAAKEKPAGRRQRPRWFRHRA